MNKLKQKFENYENKYLESKQDIDCLRRYRNGCQRIVNELLIKGLYYDNKDFYKKVNKEFEWANRKVKEFK